MTHQLSPGLHVGIVASQQPGDGGSLFAMETWRTCIQHGIPVIFVTFDDLRAYPPMGNDLRRFKIPPMSPPGHFNEAASESFASIMDEARRSRSFLVIDTKPGFESWEPMFALLLQAGLRDANSISGLMPVAQSHEPIFGEFEKHGIVFTRKMFRYWGYGRELGDHLRDIQFVNHWATRFLSTEVLDLIMTDLAPPIAGNLSNENQRFPSDHRTWIASETLQQHLLDAGSKIFEILLEPLVEPIDKSDSASV